MQFDRDQKKHDINESKWKHDINERNQYHKRGKKENLKNLHEIMENKNSDGRVEINSFQAITT